MGHLYASLAEFKAFLSGGDVGEERDAAMLVTLESASRAVDSFCRRGSGFAADLSDLIAATTLDGSIDANDTDIPVVDVADFLVNQTVKVGDEELLIIEVNDYDSLITVVRAQRDTEAVAHSSGVAVYAFRYPREVVDATLRVAQRRWKARDAGVTPVFEGLNTGGQVNMDTELSILRGALGHLRYPVVA